MWSTKKSNTSNAMVSKPEGLLADKQAASTISLPASTISGSTGWLGPTLHIRGDISGSDDLLIDGSVEGTIQLDNRRLTIGTSAKLKADINARDVVVSGHVKGNVHATRKIEIKKDATVVGNLITAELMIEHGADFKGSIEIDKSDTTKKSELDVAPIPIPTSSAVASLGANGSSQDAWTN